MLYRTNAQARMLEERFVMEGIPYDVVGGVNFYSRKEIKDILAYLKTIDNGKDDVAVRRIINIPKRGIGATTIAKVQDYARMRDISFYDALRESDQIVTIGRAGDKIRPFVDLIQTFRSKLEYYSLTDLMEDILDKTGYIKELQQSGEEDAEDRIANIDELVSKVVAYEDTHDAPTLSEFLEEVALVSDIDRVDGDDNRVLLMTLHSAKGLEFPIVYMAGMEDGVFPSYMTIVSDDPGDIEEERRLAYVGITRAREELTLTCAKQRMLRGETQYNPVSRFIKEIPSRLMDNTVLPTRRRMDEYRDVLPYGSRDTRNNASVDYRPRAILRHKVTAAENKPYIARGISALNQTAGISKGMGGITAASDAASGGLEYGAGDRVKHIKYGEGTVLKIEKEPRDYKVTVNFDSAGNKIMYAAFAKLKKV